MRKDDPTSLKSVETNKYPSIYVINGTIALYMTYRSPSNKTKNYKKWNFSFIRAKRQEIKKYMDYDLKFALICINKEFEEYNSDICLLDKDEIMNLLDLDSITDQGISIYLEIGKSFRAHGNMSKTSKELVINRSCIDNIEIPS